MIAIALSCEPALLIADEPTTALDVSVEAQILELMRSLQETTDTAIMFITHNLGVVAHMADEIVVMYMGKEVERAETSAIMGAPKHPYTQALLNSVPILGRRSRKRLAYIRGMVPSATELPSGCVFHPRCARFMAGECDRLEPGVTEVEKGHWVRCVLYQRSEKKADE
jgi:oligopeptide/dipeptide ABC transporter ATP-binding protein